MGLFSRAYREAIKSAGHSHSAAATATGLTQATVSRSAAGETLPDVANLSKLLRPLNPADRSHCLREYLLEHTPEEYRDQVTVSIGPSPEPAPARVDKLTSALRFFDEEASRNRHLEKVLIELAATLAGHSSDSGSARGNSPARRKGKGK